MFSQLYGLPADVARGRWKSVVSPADKVVHVSVEPVPKPEIESDIECLLFLPCKVRVSIECNGVSESRSVPCYGVLILIWSISVGIAREDVFITLGTVGSPQFKVIEPSGGILGEFLT